MNFIFDIYHALKKKVDLTTMIWIFTAGG